MWHPTTWETWVSLAAIWAATGEPRKTNRWNLKKTPARRGKTSTNGQVLGSMSILRYEASMQGVFAKEYWFEIGKHRRPPLYS